MKSTFKMETHGKNWPKKVKLRNAGTLRTPPSSSFAAATGVTGAGVTGCGRGTGAGSDEAPQPMAQLAAKEFQEVSTGAATAGGHAVTVAVTWLDSGRSRGSQWAVIVWICLLATTAMLGETGNVAAYHLPGRTQTVRISKVSNDMQIQINTTCKR